MNDDLFIQELQVKAKRQARIEQSSPLPLWMRPAVSHIGLHYWQFLLIVSFVIAIPVSILLFPTIYSVVTGMN